MNYIEFANSVLAKDFKYAKTMPDLPHWYTLRETWSDNKEFDSCVRFIRKNGYAEVFKGMKYIMYNLNGYKYWTMGDLIVRTILINRALVSYESDYDLIADKYDGLFDNDNYVDEDNRLLSLISIGGRVLDVGCGSGLLLDYIKPIEYVGIDPSQRMLDILKNKFPEYADKVINSTFEDFYLGKFDTIVALYGVASYIKPDYLNRVGDMLNEGGKAYLMFYKKDYMPVTYLKTGVNFRHYLSTDNGIEFGNYYIKTYENLH